MQTWFLLGYLDHVYFSLLSVDSRPTHRPTVDGRPTVGNEGDLESWFWQEKELTVSCTSCEDERNALCAARKAADGILGLESDFGGKDSIGLVTEDAGLECLLYQRQVSLGSATYNLTDYNV